MNKSNLLGAVFACLAVVTSNSSAALVNGSTLSIESGSFFEFFDLNNISFSQISTIGVDGIILGSVQPHDFSFTGPRIDDFLFLGSPGMHYTTNPTNVLSASTNMAAVDFSGWSWAFNGGAASFNLGTGSWGSNPDGVAEVICSVDCGDGDSYTLYYTATVPEEEPNGFAGFTYELSLTGTVSAVPIPAGIWLFSTGLLGLIGIARHKKAA